MMHWADVARNPFATLAHLSLILLCTISAGVCLALVGLGILADIATQNVGFALLSIVLSLAFVSLAIAWLTYRGLKDTLQS